MKVKGVKKSLSFLCIIVLTMTVFLGCQNTLDLKFNVKKGDKYKVVLSSDQKITEEINSQKINTNQNLKISYIYDIADVSTDGITTINVKFDAISAKISNGQQVAYEYDSSKASAENDTIGLAYGSMIGQGFTMKITKDGQIKEISGVDKLYTNIIDKLNIKDQKTKDTLEATLKQNFGDDALKQSMGNLTDMYPKEKSVKVGDTWESKETVTAGYPMTINNKWTMKENKSDVIALDVDSTIDTNNSATPMDLMGLKVKYTLKGTQKGTMKLAKSNGFIQSGEVNQSINGTMEIEPSQSIPKGMTVPMTIDAKTTYDITKQ